MGRVVVDSSLVESLLSNPEALMREGECLKSGNSVTVQSLFGV